MEVPNGWYEVRGPRPPSARWPLQQKGRQEVPKRRQSATSKPPSADEDREDRGCIEGFGAGSVGCQDLSRGCSAEGEDGECPEVLPAAHQTLLLPKQTRKWSDWRHFWQLWVQTTSRNGESSRKRCRRSVSAQQWPRWGNDLTSARSSANVLPSEKAQEAVTEALLAKTLREEELAEGKRQLSEFRAEAAAQPLPEPPTFSEADELSHLRRQVAQMQNELRQSHWPAPGDSEELRELRREVEELRRFRDEYPASALKSSILTEADGKRRRVLALTEGGNTVPETFSFGGSCGHDMA